jgi:hypothetical protein
MRKFAVSARNAKDVGGVKEYILNTYSIVTPTILEEVDSIFGFTEDCLLYGGRINNGVEISEADLEWAYGNGINYRIPLTNHYCTEKDYEASFEFLNKHHREGNSVIIVQDWLAKRIKKDFPKYKLEASVIKEISNVEDIKSALEIYDTVVPFHQAFNTAEKLKTIPLNIRNKVRLFITLNCAYTCSNRMCYKTFSKGNLDRPKFKFACSQMFERTKPDFIDKSYLFNYKAIEDLGFTKFKLVPMHREHIININEVGNETFRK